MYKLADFNLETITPEELGEILMSAKKAYYVDSKPIMDDHTFDTLEEILRQKTPHHRIFKKVGSKNFNTGFDKKKHAMPMGSLNKVNIYEDLVHYFELKKLPNNSEFLIEPKCDGISLEIEYKKGRVVNAITRGDGFIGDVVTQNIVKMQNFIPELKKTALSSPNGFSGSIRFEIVVTLSDFERLNVIARTPPSLPRVIAIRQLAEKQSRFDQYSNPRNAASGLSQRLDGKYSEFCTIYAVDIQSVIARSTSHEATPTELAKITLLQSLGLITVENILCTNFTDIENIYQEFLNKKRKNYPYEIDGLVIKINNIKTQINLGHHNNRPKGQVAYKFPSLTNETQIKNITWQVGPLGTITPVAEVDPIETSGAIITFASLANYDLIKEKNINIGDIVEISRRGDVIPHIEKVITKVNSGHIIAPSNCPVCDTKLVTDHKFLKCPNSLCLGQVLGVLNLFCKTLDIKNISSKTISKLFEAKKLLLPGDFYKLKVDDIATLDNLGEKSAKNIINEIQSKKELTLNQVFDAAQIPNFSHARIKQLIDFGFNTSAKLLNLKLTDFDNLPGFKITLAQKIIDGSNLRKEIIQSILSAVSLRGVACPPTGGKQSRVLSDLSFCITGDLSIPRKTMIAKIESLGGKFTPAVTLNTNYLLSNETNSNSSKFLTAKKLGVKIINENQFKSLSPRQARGFSL